MTKEDRIRCFTGASPFTIGMTQCIAYALDNMGFFDAPASSKYHGCYEGGLFDHSMNVYHALCELTTRNHLKWLREESPFVIAFFHDLCKTDQYRKTESGYEYRKDCLLTGHGEKSIMMIHEISIDITMEEIACIRYHMGAFADEKEWSYYTGAIHRYPNVLWTHTADMIATHVWEYKEESKVKQHG